MSDPEEDTAEYRVVFDDDEEPAATPAATANADGPAPRGGQHAP